GGWMDTEPTWPSSTVSFGQHLTFSLPALPSLMLVSSTYSFPSGSAASGRYSPRTRSGTTAQHGGGGSSSAVGAGTGPPSGPDGTITTGRMTGRWVFFLLLSLPAAHAAQQPGVAQSAQSGQAWQHAAFAWVP